MKPCSNIGCNLYLNTNTNHCTVIHVGYEHKCATYKEPTSELRECLKEFKKYTFNEKYDPHKDYKMTKAIVDKLESLEEKIDSVEYYIPAGDAE